MSQSTSLDAADRAVSTEHSPTADGGTREVVVGADGSRTALAAVQWAAREAAARGVPLRIVHAAPYLGEPPSPGSAPPELPRARSILATAYTAARHAAPMTQVSTELVTDAPVDALLRAGEAAQLLVLGISTTGAPDEMVLASLTQRVAARSTGPVAVVPRPRHPDAPERPVVAALAGDAADDRAVVATAAGAARRAGRPLSILDLHRERTPSGDVWDADEVRDLAVSTTAMPGASGPDLLQSVGSTPLLVLATGHAARFHRALDRQHRWLLRHCTWPMALVPSTTG